jgi:membrane fusion protein (multidrug efflux system)
VITKLYQNNPLKLEFSVPEKYRNQIKTGDEVTFTVAESPGEYFMGKVYAINPGIDPNTRTITLRAHVNNQEEKLSPGSFANVHIRLRAIPDALMIPTEALIPTTKANQVIISEHGKAKFVDVETGIRTADKVQIISGLQAGDTVLTTGIMQAKAGVPLKIIELTADTAQNNIVNASLR